ncbi:hypothetical protein [Mucilaginibacter terrae]|uniref:Aerotolerance regulator N-terminal domain-containing protein n=1 Tax=Mucilaginibacter terrae TaxID=1955052 RepID=A0ABU3GXY2_9SPHI|nr:hypothetical protein [Mucilaginibacter terrae]MDT3404619.1 hypothetical protein [Mucilaginibacter terrae]
MNWTLAVIIICTLLALLFTWQEIRRADKRRLVWRLLAIWISLGALACIILPVSYSSKTNIADNSDAILLTDGFNKDSLPPATPVYTTDKAIQSSYSKAKLISSLDELTNHQPAFKQVKIVGYGLSEDELKQLNGLHIAYTAPSAPAGIQAVNWVGKIKTGEPLQVQGRYNNDIEKPVSLILKGLNTTLDSAIIPAGTSAFQLSTVPKPTGRVVYQLLALSGNDTLSNESIPVQIEPAKPVKVLMLNAAPNFETRFLKNWLGENGYAVASRALISQNKSSEEFVNIDKMNLQHLSAGVLDKFDLVIGDLSAFKSLPPADAGAFRNQVTQKGLGVIVRADSSDKAASWLQRDFPVTTMAIKDQLSVPLTLQNQKAKTAKLNIDPSYISYRNNTQVLASDAQNHELAGITLAGAGKLAFTTLNHTNTWLLSGNKTDYTALWTLLIGQSARKSASVQSWKADAIPTVNEPVKLLFQGSAIPGSSLINDEVNNSAQNAAIPYQWQNTYWPQKAGWQQAKAGNNTTEWWYNYSKSEWNSLKKMQKIKINKDFAANQTQKQTVTKQIQETQDIEVPKIWFYMILLVACTFLWIERKFAIQL